LIIDPDTVLAIPVTLKAFKPVFRRIERHKPIRRMEPVKPQHRLPLKSQMPSRARLQKNNAVRLSRKLRITLCTITLYIVRQ